MTENSILVPSQIPDAKSPKEIHRIALVIQYQGTDFHGWQRQPKQRTVQEDIETAITSVSGQTVTLHGAGRTDSGVHAAAQVAHFDIASPIPAHRWAQALNGHLAKDVLIRASAQVEPPWHARFSALCRRYRYTIYTDTKPNLFVRSFAWHYYHGNLDKSLILAALKPLLGRHELTAFHRAGSSRPHSWVEVQEVECVERGPFIEIEVQASGFLYGMMRLLIGLLVQVGRGERTLENFADIWRNQRRELVKYAAPACGLCLLRVDYPDFPFSKDIWYDSQPKFLIGDWGAETGTMIQ